MGQRLASGGRHTRMNEPGGAAYNSISLSKTHVLLGIVYQFALW